MKKRRIVLGIVFTFLITLLLVFLVYPAFIIARFNKDLVRVSTIQVALQDKTIDLGLDIAIRREAPFHKLLDSISYTVSFDTFQFVSGAVDLDSVRSGDIFDSILLPVIIDKLVLKKAVETLKGKDSVDLTIKFVAHYQWPIIDKVDVPIEIVRRMPPPNPPEIKLVGVDVEKFSFNEPIVDISLQLINKNAFSLTLSDIHIYADFGEYFTAEVHHPTKIHVKAKDVTDIEVTAEVHELKALKTVWSLMVSRKEVPYSIKVIAKYIDEKGEAQPIDITVTTAGVIQTKSKKDKREEAGITKREQRQQKRDKKNNKKK
ncbi:hypothetical protein BH09BAC1_BH09BAC1_15340 [soil metagenome]